MFFYRYRHTDDVYDVSTTFRRFPNIIKLFWWPDERSRTFSKVFEDLRKLLKTFKEGPKMFRSYTNEVKYNLRDKLDISEIIDIFNTEDMENTPLESRM